MAVTTSHEDAGVMVELRSAQAAEALLLDIVHRHADELLRVARAHSLCADDAHDAYQRSLEQFLRHGRRLRPETADRWLFTVCKREAQAVRRSRSESVGFDEADFEGLESRHEASPEDHALAADAVTRSAEALRSLKPQEVRALWLRADGRSYAEIQAATGWSYTKVNRCLTEGRRSFLRRCAELESGVQCERWQGVLAALAGGEARAEDLAALRPHLRRCASCKATLRALHASSDSMATVLPPGLVGAAAVDGAGGAERLEAAGRWFTRLYEAVAGPMQERAATGALKWHAAVEAAAGAKVAAVAVSTVALAGGGAVVAHDTARPVRRPAQRAMSHPAHGLRAPSRPPVAAAARATVVGPVAAPVAQRRVDRAVVALRRPAGAGALTGRPSASGAKEFAVAPRRSSPAASEFSGARRRRRGVRARAARVDFAPRLVAAAPRPSAPAGTEFAPAAAPAPSTAPRRAAARPAPAPAPSPAASEFGP